MIRFYRINESFWDFDPSVFDAVEDQSIDCENITPNKIKQMSLNELKLASDHVTAQHAEASENIRIMGSDEYDLIDSAANNPDLSFILHDWKGLPVPPGFVKYGVSEGNFYVRPGTDIEKRVRMISKRYKRFYAKQSKCISILNLIEKEIRNRYIYANSQR